MPIIPAADLQNQFSKRLTAVCGFSKGSGKTTAFKWALQSARQNGPVALLTIGAHQSAYAVRSESSDSPAAVPQLQVCAGDIVLTTLPLAKASPASFEVLSIIPGRTNQGRLILGRAHRDGAVSIVGPEHFSSLRYAADMILRNKWADAVFLDGAANRITQLSVLPRLQFIYTMQISPHSLSSCCEQLAMLNELVGLPAAERAASAEELSAKTLYLGANEPLTDSALAAIPEQTEEIIIGDFSKVFLNPAQWNRLTKRCAVRARRSIHLLAVLLVLRDLTPQMINGHISALNMPVIINPLEIR